MDRNQDNRTTAPRPWYGFVNAYNRDYSLDRIAEVAAWKRRWLARMDAGFYGAIALTEEGNFYADAMVINGQLVCIDPPETEETLP